MAELTGKLLEGSVEAFTEHVQPLLLNSCATAGCHAQGSKASTFQIQRYSPSQGASQRLTQQNLRSTLRYVDPDAVETSELLTKAVVEHGGSRSAPVGSTDSAQFKTLANWVLQIAGKKEKAQQDAADRTRQAAPNVEHQPVPARGLPSQQAVVRTSDEIRALFSGHSFVEQYDQRHPQQEMVQYGLMGKRPAADFPGMQLTPEGSREGVEQTQDSESYGPNVAKGREQISGVDSLPSQQTNDLAARAAENDVTKEDQILIDQVSNLPPNRIRVGAGDPLNQDERRIEANLGTYQPRDPFDPEVFNRRFATRATPRHNRVPSSTFPPANMQIGTEPPRPLNANGSGNGGTVTRQDDQFLPQR